MHQKHLMGSSHWFFDQNHFFNFIYSFRQDKMREPKKLKNKKVKEQKSKNKRAKVRKN